MPSAATDCARSAEPLARTSTAAFALERRNPDACDARKEPSCATKSHEGGETLKVLEEVMKPSARGRTSLPSGMVETNPPRLGTKRSPKAEVAASSPQKSAAEPRPSLVAAAGRLPLPLQSTRSAAQVTAEGTIPAQRPLLVIIAAGWMEESQGPGGAIPVPGGGAAFPGGTAGAGCGCEADTSAGSGGSEVPCAHPDIKNAAVTKVVARM